MQNHIFCLLLYPLQSVEASIFMRANTDTLKTQEQIRDVLLAPETVDLIEKKKEIFTWYLLQFLVCRRETLVANATFTP